LKFDVKMDRTIAPRLQLPDHLNLIQPEKVNFGSGVDLFWMKNVPDESVKLEIEWPAGSRFQQQKLSAGFASRMMLSGTNQKTAASISEAIDFYGGFFSLESDYDHGSITLFGLRNQMPHILDLFFDAFDNAAFPDNELEKERAISLEQFRIDEEKVKVICRKHFAKALYGESSPYGTVVYEKDFDLLKRPVISEFFKNRYSITKPTFFLSGNVSDEILNKLRDWSARFSSDAAVSTISTETQQTGRVQLDQKNALQCAMRIGRVIFGKQHPDYFTFQVMNTILGGYFGSRLMTNIREDKGYTYGIGSGVASMQDSSYFFISTETGREFREKVIDEIGAEIERLKSVPVGKDELEKVKNYLLGEFLRQSDGPHAMMDCFKNIWYHQLPPDYYNRFIQAVKTCCAEDIQRVTKDYLSQDSLVTVVAG